MKFSLKIFGVNASKKNNRSPLFIVFCYLFIIVALGTNSTHAQSSPVNPASVKTENIAAAQLYVFPINLTEKEFYVGKNVSGTFTLSNIGNTDVSDTFYSINIVDKLGKDIDVDAAKKPLSYIKANSKRDVSFNYSLPNTIYGDRYLSVKIYLKDGTLIASAVQKIYIQGEPVAGIIEPSDVAVSKNGVSYIKDYGLVIGASDKLVVSFVLPMDLKTNIMLDISSNNVGSPISKSFDLSQLKNENGKYTVEIPTADFSPAEYIAKISFSSQSSEGTQQTQVAFSIKVDYRIDGLLINLKSVNSDVLSPSKNSKFNLVFDYEIFEPESGADISSELKSSTVHVIVTDESDAVVADESLPIDLSNEIGNFNLPLVAKIDAENLYISTEIKGASGKILGTYSNNLPSEKEVNEMYPVKQSYPMIYIIGEIIALILLILGITLLKKRKFMDKKIAVVIALMMFSALSYGDTKAYSVETVASAGAQVTTTSAGFMSRSRTTQYIVDPKLSSFLGLDIITSMSSPLPGDIAIYSPGGSFPVNFNADPMTYITKGGFAMNKKESAGDLYYLLPPAGDNWNNWSLADISIGKMTFSASKQISASTMYTAPTTPGVYNFTFYVALKNGAIDTYVIKKVTQPIVVAVPWNQIAGAVIPVSDSTDIIPSCDTSFTEGKTQCDKGNLGTWSCKKTLGGCTFDSTPVSGGSITSIGKAVTTSTSNAGGSVALNIKNEIPDIVRGDAFYIVTDLMNSNWTDKEYAYTEFVYGRKDQASYIPYSYKTNKHVVTYDGGDTITATSQFSGHDSKFTTAQVKIQEVGYKLKTKAGVTSCRNIPLSEVDVMFKTPTVLSSLVMCANPKHTSFSNSVSTYTNAASVGSSGNNKKSGGTVSLSVNVCEKSPDIQAANATAPFYVVVDANGTAWINTRYKLFDFRKGQAKQKMISNYGRKANYINGSYDGACTVTISSWYSGKKTDYSGSSVDITELGLMDSNLCYYQGVNYPGDFNENQVSPAIPACASNKTTCAAAQSKWTFEQLGDGQEKCTDLLSCAFKNSTGGAISNIPVNQPLEYEASYATSGDPSLLSYFWDFGDASADPVVSDKKSGTLKYTAQGDKVATLQVLLNNVIIDEAKCDTISVNCPGGSCPAGCLRPVIGEGGSLDQSKSNLLCPEGQNLVAGSFAINPVSATNSSAKQWGWSCSGASSTVATCSVGCGVGLKYCSDKKICARSCDGEVSLDKCPHIDGIQLADDPLFTVAACNPPELTMTAKLLNPYANEVTSKCSVDLVINSNAPKYTVCTMDNKTIPSVTSKISAIVGQHKITCQAIIKGNGTPPKVLRSEPITKSFRCSRVPVTIEN